jgi:ribosome biogenesis GTPase A
MANYWKLVNDVIREADILLLILDSRFIPETRNRELEYKIQSSGKKLIYIFNKCDLVNKDYLDGWKKKLSPSIFVSSTQHLGTTILLKALLRYAKDPIIVGVVGYPNTGKSSVINALRGRHSAPVSPKSGFTRSLRTVRIDRNILLIDTPGVLAFGERDQELLAVIGGLNAESARDPEGIAYHLLTKYGKSISAHYGVELSEDLEQVLEAIAVKTKKVLKKNMPNIDLASRALIREWQTGKIPLLEEEYAV